MLVCSLQSEHSLQVLPMFFEAVVKVKKTDKFPLVMVATHGTLPLTLAYPTLPQVIPQRKRYHQNN